MRSPPLVRPRLHPHRSPRARAGEPRPDALIAASLTPANRSNALVGMSGDGDCGCGGAAATESPSAHPIYIIGTIQARIPSQSVEMELAQIPDYTMPTGKPDSDPAMQRYLFDVLSNVQYLYIAREMCWVLQIQSIDSYILQPATTDALLSCITALGAVRGAESIVRSVVVGQEGGTAPPGVCHNLTLPIGLVSDIYELDDRVMDNLIMDSTDAPDVLVAHELYRKMLELAYNTGDDDSARAINFVTTRFMGIYDKLYEMTHDNNFVLNGVSVRPSQVKGGRNLLDVIYTYLSADGSSPSQQWYCTVDVTGEFPFLLRNYMLEYYYHA
ncbi:MAG: hypothetical protein H6739_01075 [Alphaproteobacteria bacterium]|nr:hypothetical protein [Alphaproteobacteria bacterium]